ncbi:MAG: hypothetical protein CMN78_02835 [Spirochaetales bacterium]|nr:hypothetical protein [Spirochaetales bacterium]
MQDKIERKRLAILKILRDEGKPFGSQQITDRLTALGYDISGRTARFHLLAMDKQGLTEYVGKRGRRITNRGLDEITNARVYEKVGFLSARINQMTFSMDFDLDSRKGSLIVNISLIKLNDLLPACPLIKRVYEKGFSMGELIALFEPGERVGETVVPAGYIGVGTVCSITLNGVLLAHKIPVNSRFGGLLEIQEHRPVRFVSIINYDGTSLDPLEIFIRSGMTDYLGATGDGNGLIGAGFREMPAATRASVQDIADRLTRVGLGGFMQIGMPNQDVSEIPVSEGNIGAVVIGGLNPIAILEEAGFEIHSRALSGHVEYSRLFSYEELEDRAHTVTGR